eukprot:1293685-Pyramimonas_sp.AAC.1
MIPKDEEGGVRPIGILSGCVRCFGKYSRVQADRWERAHDRPYHFGSRGRSCERAVWEQAIRMEHAYVFGHSAASVLVDMTKCYEKV